MMKIISTLSSKSKAFPSEAPATSTPSTISFNNESGFRNLQSNVTAHAGTTPAVPKYPFRNIAKTTSKTIHNLIKRIKTRQRKKILENASSDPSTYTLTPNITNVSSNTPNNRYFEKDFLDEESKFASEGTLNQKNSHPNSRIISTNLTQHPSLNEHLLDTNFNLTTTETKPDLPDQRIFKFVDLLKTTSKTNSHDNTQSFNQPIKSEHNDQRILEVPSLTKEIKLDQDRVIVWDELKDCIQPFGPSHDQPLNEEIHPLNPANRDTFEQWEGTEFNKRVLSSPSFNIGTVTVRAEEIGLVLVILLLWAGAISLFINRWGKLRMLEPYQPQYTAPDPAPPPRSGPSGPYININIQSTSSLSLNDNFRHSSPVGAAGIFHDWSSPYENKDHLSPRKSIAGMQSISIGGEKCPSLMMTPLSSQRRVRSAVDLVSLVMQEKIHTNSQFAATNV